MLGTVKDDEVRLSERVPYFTTDVLNVGFPIPFSDEPAVPKLVRIV